MTRLIINNAWRISIQCRCQSPIPDNRIFYHVKFPPGIDGLEIYLGLKT